MLMMISLASGTDRIILMAGMTRESSSPGETSGALGAVDWPPTSIIVAPSSIKERTAEARVEALLGSCTPPSENESGVILRMAITWVLRLADKAVRGER